MPFLWRWKWRKRMVMLWHHFGGAITTSTSDLASCSAIIPDTNRGCSWEDRILVVEKWLLATLIASFLLWACLVKTYSGSNRLQLDILVTCSMLRFKIIEYMDQLHMQSGSCRSFILLICTVKQDMKTLLISNHFFEQDIRLNNNILIGLVPESLSDDEGLTLADVSYNNITGPLLKLYARTFRITCNLMLWGQNLIKMEV
nr:protein NSP-interacting kinase 3-like [Tanacetum cinerariifolium]